MIIQYNTDKTINGDERHEEYFTSNPYQYDYFDLTYLE